jgi:hypothetical protein
MGCMGERGTGHRAAAGSLYGPKPTGLGGGLLLSYGHDAMMDESNK